MEHPIIYLILNKYIFLYYYTYYELIFSPKVYLPKNIESILGKKYFENNNNKKPNAKNTNII